VEYEMDKLLRTAGNAMIHAGRTKLKPKDVEFAINNGSSTFEKIEGGSLFEYPLPTIGRKGREGEEDKGAGKHPLGNSVLKRLAQKAGVKTISGDTYFNIRNAIYYLIFTIVRDSNTLMLHNKMKTLTLDIFEEVMQLRNKNVAIFNP
jgi:histone H3/H4